MSGHGAEFMGGRLKAGLWGLAALLSAGIALVSYRYLIGVGPAPSGILGNLFARPWLYVHVAGAATALLVSPLQFLPRIRAKAPATHRTIGRIYMVGCLVGGAAGLIVAIGSTAGPVASIGFGGLAVSWLAANAQGWRAARSRRFADHRMWMIRSFALTFAAVTLRLYLPLSQVLGLPFLDAYRAISFLCWIPNLALAELYLRGAFSKGLTARA
jgi:hypothetical protein